MSVKSCLIAVGHWNIESITSEGLRDWRSVDVLRRSTGAAGERDYHWNKVMPLLRDKLIKSGVQVYITDAIYHPEVYNRDYDLCIFLHYDGGGLGERCMVSAPNRATQPSYLNAEAFTLSEKMASIWKQTYPSVVGIPNNDSAITSGMKDYYAYDYVGMNTPTILVEHFNSTASHGIELLGNPEAVAEGDSKSIIKFLGVEPVITDNKYRITFRGEVIATYDNNPEDSIREYTQKIELLNRQLSDKTMEVAQLTTNLQTQEADNARLATDLRESVSKRDQLAVTNLGLERDVKTLTNEVKNRDIIIANLKSNDPLKAFSGWQLIRLGISKLSGR